MGKRKGLDKDRGNGKVEDDDSGSDDLDILNVEFEWFDPQPEVDFHGLRTLLRQLFDSDAQLFDLSALSDLILSQPLLGSTVKVDGNETDPYAFLTVLNLQEHKDKPVIQDLLKYLKSKAAAARGDALSPLHNLLSGPSIPPIGLILTERLINIPSEVVPPMYTMLMEEISWAVEDKEPYTFSHYLILSKTYEEVESQLDAMEVRPQKKKRKEGHKAQNELFYFHPEDEVIERHSICHGSYNFTKPQDEGSSDSRRAFQELGIKPQGHLMLIDGSKFEETVKSLSEFLQAAV